MSIQLTSIQTFSWGILKDTVLDLHNGMTAVIGETGSGKSMLLQALLFGLGAMRGDKKWLAENAEYCEVRLCLYHVSGPLPEWLANPEEQDGQIHISRRFHSQGRHRIECQGQLISLKQLTQLTQDSFQIACQHGPLKLKDPDYLLHYLDSWLTENDIHPVRKAYQKYSSAQQNLILAQQDICLDFDLSRLREVCNDLTSVIEQCGEVPFHEIESQHQKAQSQKDAQHALCLIQKTMDSEQGMHQQIMQIQKQLAHFPADETLESQLSDLSESINQFSQTVAEKLHHSDDQTDHSTLIKEMNKVCKKHQIMPEDCAEKLEKSKIRIERHQQALANIPILKNELAQAQDEYSLVASQLTQKRQSVCQTITAQCQKHLSLIGMPHAKLTWNVQEKRALTAHGVDQITIAYYANQAEQSHDLHLIASGGELSRIFMMLQVIQPNQDNVTYLFDEIDSGISGAVADQIGQYLVKLMKNHHIILISHLPQVACFADQLLYIQKKSTTHTTTSTVTAISSEKTSQALSRLLSASDEKTALEHAQALHQQACAYKNLN